MPRLTFERELASLRESLVRMGTLVESQIEAALDALRRRDSMAAEKVRNQDQYLNELFRQMREQVFMVISTQQPVARDLRYLMGIQYIATELERMGDYAVRIARMTTTLCGLPEKPLRSEFGLMGELAIGQVHDILEALIDQNEPRALEVAARDDEIDRLYHRVFEDMVEEMGNGHVDADDALRSVTLLLVAHNLERISDRVSNVAEDIVFLESGQVVELR
ncbi:MAG TPA: phosphate signaling complex protein PhoU [Candidatus Dormibacteraeota bacterium]|nr:phosphate signaling complex protein PhoU [Candidatus Dormibacteraeota bacterium]